MTRNRNIVFFSIDKKIKRDTMGTDGTEGTDGAGDDMQITGNGNVYEQIIEHYKKYITLGVITPGEKMPSCRELAIQIGVNHKTVERAYFELQKEGLIESIPKKGYFVCGIKKNDHPEIYEMLKRLKDSGITRDEIETELNNIYGE